MEQRLKINCNGLDEEIMMVFLTDTHKTDVGLKVTYDRMSVICFKYVLIII